MILEYLIGAFVFYWLFRFVFNFLVPVFRVTRQMKEQVRDFQHSTGQQYQQSSSSYSENRSHSDSSSGPSSGRSRPKAEDYIDFEEIR